MSELTINHVERCEKEKLVVYWLSDGKDPCYVGVAFRPCRVNIANQSAAESVALALSVVGKQVESLADERLSDDEISRLNEQYVFQIGRSRIGAS